MRKKNLAGKKRFYSKFVSLTLYVNAIDILERQYTLWPDFLDLIVKEKDFTPEMYDPYEEPPGYVFDASDLSGLLGLLMTGGEEPLLERYNPYYMFYSIDTGTIMNASPINWEGITTEATYFNQQDNIERFLSFSKNLYDLFKPLYGRACHKDDNNKQNTIYTYFPLNHPNAGKMLSETGFGGDTRSGVPGVYWANFFSKIYVETIGRDKFLTVPCYQKEELSDGGFMVLTSASPLDWEKPEVQELRKAMRDHLGYEYFSDINNRNRVCKVPKFDFSKWEIDCQQGMKIPSCWRE